MNELFRWLADHIYALWPVRILQPWERGVRTFCGRVGRRQLGPGVHLFIPGLGHIERVTSTLRWIETPYQTVSVDSGHVWTFALTIGYSIVDARLYWLTLDSDAETAVNLVQAAAAEELRIGGADHAAGEGLGTKVKESVRRQLRSWGIRLHGVKTTSLVGGQALRLLVDSPPEHHIVTEARGA